MSFARRIIDWQSAYGRHDLPWQLTEDPYRIWLSEVMLQQTQVATVLGYYERFLERFPNVAELARAPLDEVMRIWAGLGYYSRARNLHACAGQVLARFAGNFPRDPALLESLPGIGRSTAAAIASSAFGVPVPILDGNVKRVFCRAFGVKGYPGSSAVQRELWRIAEREVPDSEIRRYNQGLMDLGSLVCLPKRPRCGVCPVKDQCWALKHNAQLDLPETKPRRSLPTRIRYFLHLRQGHHSWLSKQAAHGIWGGLYSLPILEEGLTLEQVQAWIAHRWNCPTDQVLEVAHLTRFKHSFTHYHLDGRIIGARLAQHDRSADPRDNGVLVAEPGDRAGQFFSPEAIIKLGLPKPIRDYFSSQG